MSDITEAIGTAVEGSLFARVLGGKSGTSTDKEGNPLEKGHFSEGSCLNCGTELIGAHCHQCGQKAHLHRTIGAFLHDLMHGALHLDGKVWRTLPMLIRKPGELTRRYIDGERVRFVSPMAMFLFTVFLMFAVFQMIGVGVPSDLTFGDEGKESLANAEKTWVSELEKQTKAIENMPDGSPEHKAAQQAIDEAKMNLGELRGLRGLLGEEEGKEANLDEQGTNPGSELRNIPFVAKLADKWTENPSLMLYKLQANGYKFSWLLIPLSIPFVWLTFAWRKRYKAYDHAIFVTYSLAFMSLLFIALSALYAAGIGGGWIFLALAVIAPIHIYKHLRHGYGISRFSATWRLFALLFFITIILTLFLQALLLIGAF